MSLVGGFTIAARRSSGCLNLRIRKSMDDDEKEKDEERTDIQAYHSRIIREFRDGLLCWLRNESALGEVDEFEDRDLDRLLLKVPYKIARVNQDRTVSRATEPARFGASVVSGPDNTVLAGSGQFGVQCQMSTLFQDYVSLHKNPRIQSDR